MFETGATEKKLSASFSLCPLVKNNNLAHVMSLS